MDARNFFVNIHSDLSDIFESDERVLSLLINLTYLNLKLFTEISSLRPSVVRKLSTKKGKRYLHFSNGNFYESTFKSSQSINLKFFVQVFERTLAR